MEKSDLITRINNALTIVGYFPVSTRRTDDMETQDDEINLSDEIDDINDLFQSLIVKRSSLNI